MRIVYIILCTPHTQADDYIVSIVREVKPQYQLFIHEVHLRKIVIKKTNLSIYFVNHLDSDIVGECFSYVNGEKVIKISFNYWKKAFDEQKEELIFHELGHCLLNIHHIERYKRYDIMNPMMLPKGYYTKNRNKLINNLFDDYLHKRRPVE